MRLRSAALLLLVCMAAAAGCSTQDAATGTSPAAVGDPRQQPPLGAVQQITNAEDLSLPIDYYRATAEQRVTLLTANNMLIRDCMRRFGFDWQVH